MSTPPMFKWCHFQADIILLNVRWYCRYTRSYRDLEEMTALGRAGLPDDIGPMIASLLSEDNRWINAQRIEVSGGMSI